MASIESVKRSEIGIQVESLGVGLSCVGELAQSIERLAKANPQGFILREEGQPGAVGFLGFLELGLPKFMNA